MGSVSVEMADNLRIEFSRGLEVDAHVIVKPMEVTRLEQNARIQGQSAIFQASSSHLDGAPSSFFPFKRNSHTESYAVQRHEALQETNLYLGRLIGNLVNYSSDFALRING